MFGAQRFLSYAQGTLIKGFGLCKFALVMVKLCEVAKAHSHLRVSRSIGLLLNFEHTLIEWFGLGKSAQGLVQQCQIAKRAPGSRMVGTKFELMKSYGFLRER